MRVFVGMVKGDAELKIFHSMLKYNNFFVAQHIYGNVMDFMGDRILEGRPWSIGQYTKCSNKSTGTIYGADGSKTNPKKYSRGRTRNGSKQNRYLKEG